MEKSNINLPILTASCLVPFSQAILLKLRVKTATEVGVRAIQDHKVIEWNTCWKCRLSEGTDDM